MHGFGIAFRMSSFLAVCVCVERLRFVLYILLRFSLFFFLLLLLLLIGTHTRQEKKTQGASLRNVFSSV